MIKTFSQVLGLLCVVLFLLVGCGDEKTTVTKIKRPANKEVVVAPKTIAIKTKTEKPVDLSDVFADSAKIAPSGKYMIIIFESDNSPYCIQLNKDIYNNLKLKNELKNEFSTYLLNAKQNRMHKLHHEKNDMEVDTKTLISIYNVTGTPTLIFSDKSGKSILIVPGYMSPKQFLVTLNFIKEQKWLGLNRKNGDVYKALKNYYIDNGIIKPK